MEYLSTFLEGVITFISPCVLPMIPVYLMYFAGGENESAGGKSGSTKRTFFNSLGFVAGFSVIFILLGVFAGSLSGLISSYRTVLNIVCGAVVVFFGLHYTGIIKIGFLNKTFKPRSDMKKRGFFSAVLFGIIFAVGWSPCTGAFLGTALMTAAANTGALKGMWLLAAYSLGLGVPFLLSALFIDSLKGAFTFIKRHYKVINTVCGVFLIIVGVLMMTGLFQKLTALLS